MSEHNSTNDTTRTKELRDLFGDHYQITDRVNNTSSVRYFVVRGDLDLESTFRSFAKNASDYTVVYREVEDYAYTGPRFMLYIVRDDLVDRFHYDSTMGDGPCPCEHCMGADDDSHDPRTDGHADTATDNDENDDDEYRGFRVGDQIRMTTHDGQTRLYEIVNLGNNGVVPVAMLAAMSGNATDRHILISKLVRSVEKGRAEVTNRDDEPDTYDDSAAVEQERGENAYQSAMNDARGELDTETENDSEPRTDGGAEPTFDLVADTWHLDTHHDANAPFVASDDDGWIRSEVVITDPDYEFRMYEGKNEEWLRTTTPWECVE